MLDAIRMPYCDVSITLDSLPNLQSNQALRQRLQDAKDQLQPYLHPIITNPRLEGVKRASFTVIED